jgi:hypothetical protein
MGNEGGSPSARWTADPTGRHAYRYWDGSQWTGHVSDGAVAPLEFPDTTGAQPPPLVTETAEGASPDAGEPEEAAAPQTAEHTESADARPESLRRQRRQVARRRRAFWVGALAGAGLVLVGVAVAVLLLDVKVNTTSQTAKRTKTPTTTAAAPSSSTTTTTVNPGRPPQQVRVEVINASAVAQAAGTKAFALGALGYKIAGLADAPVRQGTAVQCKPGFEAEAATLAKNVGAGTTVEPFPNPPPTGSTNADCVVALGK